MWRSGCGVGGLGPGGAWFAEELSEEELPWLSLRRDGRNLAAVCEEAGGGLNDICKLNVFLTDLGRFAEVNAIMAEYFSEPYPARAAVQVALTGLS